MEATCQGRNRGATGLPLPGACPPAHSCGSEAVLSAHLAGTQGLRLVPAPLCERPCSGRNLLMGPGPMSGILITPCHQIGSEKPRKTDPSCLKETGTQPQIHTHIHHALLTHFGMQSQRTPRVPSLLGRGGTPCDRPQGLPGPPGMKAAPEPTYSPFFPSSRLWASGAVPLGSEGSPQLQGLGSLWLGILEWTHPLGTSEVVQGKM